MFVFGNRPGVVGTVVTGSALPFAVVVGGNPGVYAFPDAAVAKGIVTGFKDAGESGLGVSHTLNDRIYFWVFGERAGAAEVSGLAFADTCPIEGGQGSVWSGFDVVSSYYEQTRVSTTGLPVRLVFGPRTTRWGMLHKFRFSLDDPSSGLGSFSFEFVTIPRPMRPETPLAPVWTQQAPPGVLVTVPETEEEDPIEENPFL